MPLKVAILGSGHVASDLLSKVIRSASLTCVLMAGRRSDSPGLQRAAEYGVNVSDAGIDAVVRRNTEIDLVFDATSARDAASHWISLQKARLPMIDLTPARLGQYCIPVLNLSSTSDARYLSMLSCGGQAAVPLVHAVSQLLPHLAYIEVVSTAASASVGAATRSNLDEYITSTQDTIHDLCGYNNAKTVLLISAAKPPPVMSNTIAFEDDSSLDLGLLTSAFIDISRRIRRYVPGYEMVVPPTRTAGRVLTTVHVRGQGDWLPEYAGNLDIITCAAVAAAEARA